MASFLFPFIIKGTLLKLPSIFINGYYPRQLVGGSRSNIAKGILCRIPRKIDQASVVRQQGSSNLCT